MGVIHMKIKKSLLVFVLVLLASMGNLVLAKQAVTQFSLTELSLAKHYKVSLVCEKALSVGNFQQCHLDIFQPGSETKILKNAKISLNGGMPAHHHGLPTSPVVVWSAKDNNYKIEGLKFSMPGEWELRLLIENNPANPAKIVQDRVLFTFTI